MTQEQNAKLLQAYRAAIAAGQDGIADMLEDVILDEMSKEEPTWKVTCSPDVVPLGGTRAAWMLTDHISKEATA